MSQLQAALDSATERMGRYELQLAQTAKREGWNVIGRGKCWENGPELVRVEYPESYSKLEAYRNCKTHDFKASDYDA
jgi:hypothetical protein